MTVTLWDPVLAGEEVTVKFSNISVFRYAAPHPGSCGQPSGKLEQARSDECDGGAAL